MATSDRPKLAALMLVYNHLPQFDSIRVALPSVDFFLLIDNGSRESIRHALEEFCAQFPRKVRLLPHGTNLGLSQAYNHAVGVAKEMGAYWICFLDHDATFDATLLPTLQIAWLTMERECDKLGMVVPIVTDDPGLLHSTLGFRRKYTFLRGAITSGILTTVTAFDSIGGFNPNLYVEAADFEFTKRAVGLGHTIGIVHEVLICQEFENAPNATNVGVRLGNRLMRLRSLVQLGIGNGNMFRTRLSFYARHRMEELHRNMGGLIQDRPEMRSIARTVLFLDWLEELYLRIIGELPLDSGDKLVPNPMSTHGPQNLPHVAHDEEWKTSPERKPSTSKSRPLYGNASEGNGGDSSR